MNRAFTLLIALVVACAPASPPEAERPATSTRTETAAGQRPPTAPVDTTSPPSARPEISIDGVAAGNPLVVSGHARTFENAVTVRLLDSAGAVIAEDHVTSVGETGQHNPYRAELWVVREPGPKMTVEALEYSARDGSIRSLVRKSVDTPTASTEVSLVLPTRDCTEFSTFRRNVPRVTAVARLVVEALLHGPSAAERAAGATAPFPQGSDVKSVILRDGVLTVDLNERLQNVGGACQATAIRESLTRSLTQLPSVRRVVITAGGSETLALQP